MNFREHQVIKGVGQINKEWITTALKLDKSDGLKDFQIEYSESTNSQVAKIKVEYETGAKITLPTSFILKMCGNDDRFIKDSEVNYYTKDYSNLENLPIPVCFDAQYSNVSGSYHILMEDLSETHQKDTFPTFKFSTAVAEALANLHAHGWGKEKITALGQSFPDKDKINSFLNHVKKGFDPLIEEVSNEINPLWRAALNDIFNHHPKKMLERIKNPIGFAVVHGDVNPGNILYPKNGQGKVYLLDRQPFTWSLTVWLAVHDLAYMLVPFWQTDVRRELEIPTLKKYHQQLLKNGVTDYYFEQLLYDYKLTAMQGVYVAAEWCILETERKKMRWLWFSELEKSLQAYFDLNCSELF
jgi:thiamine kinase-like enzyme